MPVEPLTRREQPELQSTISITNIETGVNELIVEWEADTTGLSELEGEVRVTNDVFARETFSLNLTGDSPIIQDGRHQLFFDLDPGQVEEATVTVSALFAGSDSRTVTLRGPTETDDGDDGTDGGDDGDGSENLVTDVQFQNATNPQPGDTVTVVVEINTGTSVGLSCDLRLSDNFEVLEFESINPVGPTTTRTFDLTVPQGVDQWTVCASVRNCEPITGFSA